MKNFKYKIVLGFAAISFLFGVESCETIELEILDSPNALTPEQSSPDFYVNSIQLSLADFFVQMTEPGQELTRILHMFGPLYQNAYAPQDFDTAWSIVYAEIMAEKPRTACRGSGTVHTPGCWTDC